MKVRYASENDLSEIYRLCWAGYKELKEVAPEKVDPDLLWKWIIKAHKQAPQLLLVDGDEILGFWGLCTVKAAWSYDWVLADYMFYIKPDYRSLKATQKLVQAVKDVADSHNLTFKQSYLFKGKLPLHVRIFNMMGFSVSGLIGFYKGN